MGASVSLTSVLYAWPFLSLPVLSSIVFGGDLTSLLYKFNSNKIAFLANIWVFALKQANAATAVTLI